MIFQDFFAKLAGKWIKNKINLEDTKMDNTKPWYKSLTIWSGVVAVLVATYNSVSLNVHPLPVIPDWIFALLGAVGVYGRKSADTKIG